jgi:ADP-ribose pyrophosphatase
LPESERPPRIIYQGSKIKLALKSVELRDGTTAEREVVLHRGAVALVPLVAKERVCLVHNRRYAIGKTLLEVPAGTIDAGETPEQTAQRELQEETGYRAGRLVHLRDWYVSPGFLNERMHLFLCDELVPAQAHHQPDEHLQIVVVPWAEAVAMALDGRIEDAKTILALLICDRRTS